MRGLECGEVEHCCLESVTWTKVVVGCVRNGRTTVSTDEEDDIECLGFSDKIGKLLGVLPEGCLILKEFLAIWILFEEFDRVLV